MGRQKLHDWDVCEKLLKKAGYRREGGHGRHAVWYVHRESGHGLPLCRHKGSVPRQVQVSVRDALRLVGWDV